MTLRRYLTRLVWLCVMPLLLLATYLAVDSVLTLRSQRESQADYLVRNVATALDRDIVTQITALEMLAASPLADDPERWGDLYREAQAFVRNMGTHVILADAGGQMLFNTRVPFGTDLPLLPKVAPRAAAPKALATGKPAVGDRFIGPVAEVPLVAIAVPVMRDGRPVKLVLATIETSWFQNRLRQLALPSGWSMRVEDSKQDVIAATGAAEVGGDADPVRFSAPSAASPWSVILEVPQDVYSGQIWTAALLLGAGVLGATLVSLLGGRAAATRLAGAVQGLTQAPGKKIDQGIAEIAAVGSRLAEMVTAQEQARQTAEQSEKVLRQVLELVPVGIWILDEEGRVIHANPAARKIWEGVKYVGIEGFGEYKGWWRRNGKRIEAHEWTAARAIRNGEVAINEEVEIECFDGVTRKFIHNSALPIRDETGRIVGAITTNEDITERVRSEEALKRAKEQAEQANVAKSRFLAAASHDLRQPMQSLMLFASILDGQVATDRGREALRNLEQGLSVLKDLLDSLLDVSRLDAAIVKPNIEEFSLDELLDQVRSSGEGAAAEKRLSLEVEPCGAAVRSDRTLLGRMLRNLVENALRYTESGGVTVACQLGPATVRIQVRDTGIGIPADQLDKIFEEFHQVGNHARDRAQGLGLGLAIVRRLSELLDHPVEVLSEPAVGTTFSIVVPRGTDELVGQEEEVEPRKAAGVTGHYVVLVEDDEMVLEGLRTILQSWGYRVEAAASPDKAIALFQETRRRPDVIVSDYRMPGATGVEVILKARELFGHPIPGVLLTGETGPEAAQQAILHGLRLLHKPVLPEQLASTLQGLVP